MLTPNEYMTWDEAVKKYPDSWVVFDKNCKAAWGGEPLEGIVIAVCSDDEIDDYLIDCRHNHRNVHYERTSYKTGVGIINVEGISIKVD